MSYAQTLIDRGGGICTCGEHLGVFVAKPEYASRTPAGWVFVDVTTTTEQELQDAIEHATRGRATWPQTS